MTKKLTALILILGSCFTAFAETFVVTSNADSGPGTLREAIQKAADNGTAVTDYIHFNLTDISQAGRTIVIQSELPLLTSNLVIDASTQPGSKLGVSDAKVVLRVYYTTNVSQKLFRIYNQHNIKVYSLKIINDIIFTAFYPDEFCFHIKNSSNIEIGDAGKGNVIVKWEHAIQALGDGGMNKNISIFSNFIGLNEDGITPEYNEHAITISSIENLKIGDYDPLKGNVITGARRRIQVGGTAGIILIANNKVGTNHAGMAALSLPYGEANHFYDNIAVSNSFYIGEINKVTDVIVVNNQSAGSCRSGIYLQGLEKKIIVKGNKIGTDVTGKIPLGDFMDYGIWMQGCRAGIIGVEDEEETEKNIIAFAKRGSTGVDHMAGSGIGMGATVGIVISRNSIFCNQNQGIGQNITGPYTYAFININRIENNIYYGTANPNARIEIFEDDECDNCEGKKYVTHIKANNKGEWSYAWTNPNVGLVATATDAVLGTSEFTKSRFKVSRLQIQHTTCGSKNGSISGLEILSGTNWHWENFEGQVVSTDSALTNAAPGKYRLVITIGKNQCKTTSEYFEIYDLTPLQTLVPPTIRNANCGQSTGSIQLNNRIYEWDSKWLNATSDSIGTGDFIYNLAPGRYYLKLWVPQDTTCSKLYGPFEIINQSGPSLNLDKIAIANTTCEGTNGSIKNISTSNITGTPFIQWVDTLNNVVGTTLDLVNVSAGRYSLKLKDESSCDTIITAYFLIENSGALHIDTSQMVITSSQCPYASGTVKGITVTGATNYKWYNSAGSVVSRELDPGFLFPGKYVLIAGNAAGCEKRIDSIFVPTYPYMHFSQPLGGRVKPGFCGENDGYARFPNFPNPQNYTFRWVDSLQPDEVFSTQLNLEGVRTGMYYLYAKDAKGCEQKAATVFLDSLVPPQFDESKKSIGADLCAQQAGKIENLQLQPGTGLAPFTFTWLDEQGTKVGDALQLQNKGEGKYRLVVQDRIGCRDSSSWLQVDNHVKSFSKPQYDDQIILRNTPAILATTNLQQGQYFLYDSPITTAPLQQNESGLFQTGNLATDKTYYIQLKTGACESEIETVQIKVVDETKVFVPTAFSPNSDGKNDVLRVKAIGIFHLENFAVYDRWGGLVFQSADINKGWNGQSKNRDLPDGVYVWMIKGKDIKGNVIFQKGTTMLLR